MTKDDIIRMAREGKSVVEQVHAYVSLNKTDYTSEDMARMVRDFIEAEREECAKVCENFGRGHIYTANDAGVVGHMKQKLAAAIRARGKE